MTTPSDTATARAARTIAPPPEGPAFVWPPVEDSDHPIVIDRTDDLDPSEPVPAAGHPVATGHRSALALAHSIGLRLESDLIGVRAISFRRWADAAGWQRDGSDACCWRCAGSVGPHEVDGDGCAACREKRLAWGRAIRLGRYESGLRSAILELKFGRWRRTGHELGRELGDAIRAQLDAGDIRPDEAALVPVPMSWRRRMSRGVDHTAVLAAAASRQSGVRVVRAMGRKHRRPQVGLSATARAANVRGAFVPAGGGTKGALANSGIRVVIVLDDVRTTGATMTAACRGVRAMIGRSPEIWCCVGCVAAERRRRGANDAGVGREDEKFAKTFGVAI